MKTDKISHLYLYDDPSPRIQAAFDHFDTVLPQRSDERTATLNPNIQDSDGLVSYIVASSNPPPQEIKKLYDELRPIMEGLTNVVVSAVIKSAGTDPKKRHDPATWRAPMAAMVKAFCSGFSETTRSYDQRVRGVEVSSKFISILIEAVASQGAALADFTQFLTSQGQTIKAEVSTGQNSYLYACVSIVHEIFEASDGRWIYVPKFKSYFTRFSQETLKLTSSCASFSDFQFKFDLDIMTGAFMVGSWENFPAFRDKVRAFISRFQQANIEDSTNFFDGIFNSNPAIDAAGNSFDVTVNVP